MHYVDGAHSLCFRSFGFVKVKMYVPNVMEDLKKETNERADGSDRQTDRQTDE